MITTPKAPFVLGIYFIGTCMESIVYILTVECHLMYREQCLDNFDISLCYLKISSSPFPW
jgi:hypothetical protein